MSEPIVVAAIAFLSAFSGGLFQAFSARALDRGKFEREAKWNLYTNYFVCLGELTFAQEGTPRYSNALATMAQIRGRIAVIGSPHVVQAVGQVFKYDTLQSEDAQTAMSAALEAMRRDVGQRMSGLDAISLRRIMFGSRDFVA